MPALLLLALTLPCAALDFAPTPALEQLAQATQDASAASRFPSCQPQAGWAWCPTNAEAFTRTLAPAEKAKLLAAYRSFLTVDVAGELRERTKGDGVAQPLIDAFVANVNDPNVDAWRLANDGAGIVAVGFQFADQDVIFPLTIDKLFPLGLSTHLARRYRGLACDAEFIAFFARDGRFLRVNPFLGACHDADE